MLHAAPACRRAQYQHSELTPELAGGGDRCAGYDHHGEIDLKSPENTVL